MSQIARSRIRQTCLFTLTTILSVGLISTLASYAITGEETSPSSSDITLTQSENGSYHLVAKDVSVKELAEFVSKQTDVAISTDADLANQIVSVDETHADLESLIKSISDSNAIVFERVGDEIRLVSAFVTSKQESEPDQQPDVTAEEDDSTEKLVIGYKLTNLSPATDRSKLDNRRIIAMRNALIDTTRANRNIRIDVPPALAARPDTRWHIVQFDGKIGESERNMLEDAGFKIGHFIPQNALAVQAEPDRVDALKSLPGVYFVEPYHPYLKVSEDILGYLSGEAPDEVKASVASGHFSILTHYHEADLDSLSGIVTIESKSQLDGGRVMIRVSASPEDLVALAQLDAVQWVEVTSVFKSLNDTGNQQLRANAIKRRLPTLTGTGVVVAVTDSGIDLTHLGFAKNTSLPANQPGNSRIVHYEQRASVTADGFPGDTDGHGTHVAGSVLGNGFLSSTVISSPGSKGPPYSTRQFGGIAPDAQAVIIEDFNSYTAGEQVAIAWSNNARIANNSWGAAVYKYNTESAVWDVLVRDALPGIAGQQEFTAFFAAGNDGGGTSDGLNGIAGTILTPANAKNVITVGAIEQPRLANNLPGSVDRTDSDWQVADFSSRGPVDVTEDVTQLDDIRTKPDVVAPGVYVISAQSHETNPDILSTPFDVNWDYQSGNINSSTNYAFFSGTSMASPLAAGIGALYLEYYKTAFGKNPSPAVVKAAMVGGARNVNTLVYRHPQNPVIITRTTDQGWGMVDAARTVFGTGIHPSDQLIVVDQEAAINTAQFYSRQVTVNPGEGGLKIVLAWTDVPGNPAVERQLVNNLDLLVLAPGGGGYVGNRFASDGIHSERFNVPSPNEGDPYNNVEVVLISDAAPGTYTIRAYGNDVPQGPQDFAMFIMKGVGLEQRFSGDHPAIAFNTANRPHVAFSGLDEAGNRQIFVKQWRGDMGDLSDLGDWRRLADNWFNLNNSAINVGISASLADSTTPSIAVSNDQVHVAWIQHQTTGTNVFLKYYNGTNWNSLGQSASGLGVSSNTTFGASKPVVKLDGSGNPVVAWRQRYLTTTKINVIRWNGTNWVGYAGSHTNGVGDASQADNPTMTINSSGNPVIAWEELTTQRIHVWQWNGASWVNLGQRGSASYAGSPHLDSASNGDLFLTWMQITGIAPPSPYQIYAERRTGGSWIAMAGSNTGGGLSQETNLSAQVYSPQIAYSPAPTPRVYVSWLTRTGTNTSANLRQHIIGAGSWTGISGSEKYPGIAVLPGSISNVVLATSALGLPVATFENDGASGSREIVSYGLVSDIVSPNFGGIKTAIGGTNNDVRISWNTATDNLTVSTNMRYNIYMGTNKYLCFDAPSCSPTDVFGNRIATVTNVLNLTVTNLVDYEQRCFAVRAVDSAGNEEKNTIILFAAPYESGVACLDRDSNTNGLPDWWEFTWFGSVTGANPTSVVSTCVGGLTVSNAFKYSTDPFSCDSDNDGLTDFNEVFVNNTFPGSADTDQDGLDDNLELFYGSNPKNADSNGNRLSDGDMIRLGFSSPTNVVAAYSNLYIETFEASSLTRTNWAKSIPNQAYPLNFWHLSTAEPVPGIPGVVRINDRSTNTSYRMAIDVSANKTNASATYNAGTNQWVAGLDSPRIDASTVNNLFVTWKEYHNLEANQDFVQVQARSATLTNWFVVSVPNTGSSGDWVINNANISFLAGHSNVQIRLLFTANDMNNSHSGWYVDDVVFYSGLIIGDDGITNGWVRDIHGCPVIGANVQAIGSVVLTNTVDGNKVVQPGKVFGAAITDNRGVFSIRGLPRGKYIIKADHPSFRSEFWNGQLFSPAYGFGNGINPGVPSINQVSLGIVNLSTGGPVPEVDFELEPGDNQILLGVAAPIVDPVSVNYVTPITAWNGSTSAPGLIAFSSVTNLSVAFSQSDWYTNAVAPNYLTSLMPGNHFVGISSNRWRLNRAEVETRLGEQSRVGIATNSGNGFVYVVTLDGTTRGIWINGANTGSNTPALIKLQAGQHLVQLSTTGDELNQAILADIPLGGRTNITFSDQVLNGELGDLILQTFDEQGNEIEGADIFLNGRLVSTNSAPGVSSDKTPSTLSLVAGTYHVSFRKAGYRLTAPATYGVLIGQSTYVSSAMYQDDADFDRVGDYTEDSSFATIFTYSGIDDPDSDGLNNRREFDFSRAYGIELSPLDPDSDNDGMLDGEEISVDGYLSQSNHLMYAATTLSTNAIEGSDNLRLRFVGRYLDGIWNFGTNSITRLSVNGDIVEAASLLHTAPAVPSRDCVETVLSGVPPEIVSKAITYGQPVNTRVFADTDPSLVDTDNDDMWDGYEYNHQFMTNSFLFVSRILDPIGAGATVSDPDADGLDNHLEFLGPDGIANLGDSTDPRDGDSDGDGMPDGWEYFYALDPNDPLDGADDPDNDFLPNDMEYVNGTNPQMYDTDADGLSDGEEVIIYLSNPLNPDTDGDGLFDGQEIILGVNPSNWDTDGDGMPDGFEVLDYLGNLREPGLRLNPLDPSDADEDYDGDGLSNLDEYLIRDGLVGNPPVGVVWDYSTDPFMPDTDGDGMPDGWEGYYGLHPVDPVIDTLGATNTRNSALSIGGDLDADGLWNFREYNIRFYLDPNADANAIFGQSTDPRDVDTDDDGLWDGEEDRAFSTHPHLQDTDIDHLFDGASQPPHWSEVESTIRVSDFLYVSCSTCTWYDANIMAQIPHPDFPSITGQLATLQFDIDGLNPELDFVINNLISGTESNIAIGGINSGSTAIAFTWIDNGGFWLSDILNLDILPFLSGQTNYLSLKPTGIWSPIISNTVVDAFIIEWEDVPQVTNHYDMAFNDLWQLRWPGASSLPFWQKIIINSNSPSPPPRWGAAATYVPVFETKNPRDDFDPDIPTKILLDNRQLVIFGGRDGVTKHRDVWEYVVRSNSWIRSTSPLNDVPFGFLDGLSEMSAVTVFKSKNTGCTGGTSGFEDRSEFGYPKSRPWSDSRSFDWTYFFGGWDNRYSYTEAHAYYKSTDDPRPITESKGVDVGVAEFLATNVTPPSIDFLSTAATDGDFFLIGNNTVVEDKILQPFSAMQINAFALRNECDFIESAVLTIEIDNDSVGVPFDIDVYGEIKTSLDHSDPNYESTLDIQEPSARLTEAAFFTAGPVTLSYPGGVGTFNVDVTEIVRSILSAPGGWDSTVLGFVLENNAPGGFVRVDRNKSFITVTYKPSYKLEPYWTSPTLIRNISSTRSLSKRKSVAMAYDYTRDRIVLFGGIDGNDVMGETYEGQLFFNGSLDPTTVEWIQKNDGIQPPARWGHSLVYDAKNQRMVMFGGFDADHKPLNDLWIYTTTDQTVQDGTNTTTVSVSSWLEVTEFDDTQRPMPRGGASMIYFGGFDYSRGIADYSAAANKQKVVLFGGTDGRTYFNDTWVLDDGSETRPPRWILASPVGEQSQGPEPRAFASFVFAQNARTVPDPLGATEYRANKGVEENGDAAKSAKNSALLFGGRAGTIPTGIDTDRDMVDDGIEHALGGTAGGRDPRINRLIYVAHPSETIPFAIKRLGSKPSTELLLRGAVANFESLRHDDGSFAIARGFPWETHVDPFSRVTVSGGAPQPGVDALLVDQTDLWYHRAAYGDPNDPSDVWDLGVPYDVLGGNSSPPYAYSGRWVYGTKLEGNYPNDAVIDLLSPRFDLTLPSLDSTDIANPNSFFLVFHEWLDLADANDYVQIEVIRPGTPADLATRTSGTNYPPIMILPPRSNSDNTTGEWRKVAVPLNAIANEPNLFLRFRLGSDSAGNAGGWYIDDVAIVQGGEISGVLTNFGPGITMGLYGANDGNLIQESITSENGEFGFGLLPQGNYLVGSQSATSSVITIVSGAWGVPMVNVPVSALAFSLVNITTSANTIYWQAEIGVSYQVEYVDSIDGIWLPLGGVVVAASTTESIVDPGPIPITRFYRVKALNQP